VSATTAMHAKPPIKTGRQVQFVNNESRKKLSYVDNESKDRQPNRTTTIQQTTWLY
jgi:hypothetical protein